MVKLLEAQTRNLEAPGSSPLSKPLAWICFGVVFGIFKEFLFCLKYLFDFTWPHKLLALNLIEYCRNEFALFILYSC